MATYVYRCDQHGTFDVRRPLGQAPTENACPGCGSTARRVFTAPHVGTVNTRVVRAMDAAARTSDAPEVVTQPPARSSVLHRQPTLHPATARLPRP